MTDLTDDDRLSLRVLDLGDDGVTAVTVEIACMRCGGPLRALATDNPTTVTTVRARRLSITCTDRDCRWAGVLVLEIADLTVRRR